MILKLKLPDILPSEMTPLVEALLAIIGQLFELFEQQKEQISQLKDEIRVLKKQKKKPAFKPSKMDEKTEDSNNVNGSDDKSNKTNHRQKKSKTRHLSIHSTEIIQPDFIPEGAIFKGYSDYVVQDIKLALNNTCYRLARHKLLDGTIITGQLPEALKGHHFGTELRTHVLYQYHQCQVTQPLLLEQLTSWGIDISSGQLNNLLLNAHDEFHNEKADLLKKGLTTTGYVTVDDTGARHQGKNGYVTHIGNEFFAWFSSTHSKSRQNFLCLLNGGKEVYRINDVALNYMKSNKLASAVFNVLQDNMLSSFDDKERWILYLSLLGITNERHIRIITEGALLGALLDTPDLSALAIVSDGAGQFNVLHHGLCWVHAERLVHLFVPLNETQRQEQAMTREAIWALYKGLKDYKKSPSLEAKQQISTEFDRIFTQKTQSVVFSQLLKRLHTKKEALLLVLERPEIPIHTNGSENDLREQVKRRKVSGGTRSDKGRICRDTFSSLKKTCKKLGISFLEYLSDRISKTYLIPKLGDLVIEKSQATTTY